MNITYILPTLNRVAPITVIVNIIKEIYINNNIQVITLKKSSIDNYIDDLKRINIRIIQYSNIIEAMKKNRIINFHNVDLIHLNGLQPNIYGLYLKRKYHNIKSITTAHSVEDIDFVSSRGRIKGTIGYILNSFLYKNQDMTIAVSNDVKEYLISKNINNVKVIHNGLDISKFLDYKKNTNNYISLIQVGKINKNKNQLYSLELLNYLVKINNMDIKLFIVGGISDEEYKITLDNYIEDYQLKENVFFVGNLNFVNLCQELSNHDILIMPSYTEGLPLSPLEGYYYNLPSITSSNGGLKEVNVENQTGIFIDINNNKDFIKVKDFIKSNEYKNISKNVKKYLLKKFTASIMAEKYLKTYKELINEKTT